MANISRNSFNESAMYDKVIMQQGMPYMDYDYNEMQDIQRVKLRRIVQELLGDGILTGFQVSPTTPTASMAVTVPAGTAYVNGYRVIGSSATNINVTAPASGTRTDVIYLDVSEAEINSVQDTNIKASQLTIEPTRRTKVQVNVVYAQNTSVAPVNTQTNSYYLLATLSILSTTTSITAGLITDKRLMKSNGGVGTTTNIGGNLSVGGTTSLTGDATFTANVNLQSGSIVSSGILSGTTLRNVTLASTYTFTNNGTIVGGNINGSTIGKNGVTQPTIDQPNMTGTWTGTPTFSGSMTFSGNPTFSGTPTFSGSTAFTAATSSLKANQVILGQTNNIATPGATLYLASALATGVGLDGYGNLYPISPASMTGGQNWGVYDKTPTAVLKVYLDATKKVTTVNNTLDDGSGNFTVSGNIVGGNITAGNVTKLGDATNGYIRLTSTAAGGAYIQGANTAYTGAATINLTGLNGVTNTVKTFNNTLDDSTGKATFIGAVTAPNFISNIATGTAPLTVTSTTAVTNLNADMTDGYHLNQDVRTTASPTFVGATLSSGNLSFSANGQRLAYPSAGWGGLDLTASATTRHINIVTTADTTTPRNIWDVEDSTNWVPQMQLLSNGTIKVLNSSAFVQSPTFTSTVATGTAPFSITSTTKVANLNVDQVDGYDFNQDVRTTASPSFVALTSTVATGTAPFTVASTTMVNNLNAQYLNGYGLSPVASTPGTAILSTVPVIKSDSVIELGKYVDLHDTGAATQTDYDVRLSTTGTGVGGQGTLGLTGNGTVSGTFTVTGLGTFNGGLTVPSGQTTTINGLLLGAYSSNGDITGASADLNGSAYAVSIAAPASTTVDPFGIMTGGGVNAVKAFMVGKTNVVTTKGATLDDGSGNSTFRTITSNVANGTAPFTVTSNTQVNNLNVDFLNGLHASDFQRVDGTTIVSTASTGGTFNGQYTKVATINVTAQYGYVNTTLLFMAGADGASTLRKAVVDIRVKQQNAMAAVPYYELDLVEATGGVIASDFVALISANTASVTTVDLYFRISNQFEQYSFVSLIKNSSSGTLALLTGQSFVATLPAGTQIVCTDLTKAKKTGDTFTGTITAPTFTSNVATGTAPFTVTSTTAVTNLNADMTDGYHMNQDVQTTASPSFSKVTSTVATGTAPFTVTSTTAVTNLNADMVDGFHMNQDVRTTGTPTFASVASTGAISATALTSTIATGTAPFTVTSTTKVTNLNADMADGYHFNQGVQTTDTPTFSSLTTTGVITAGTNITITPNATATSTTNYGSDAFQLQSSTWNGTSATTNTRKMTLDSSNVFQFTNISGANVATIDNSGNMSGTTFTSTVATGTAPFTVTSTTKVTNLNADLLDGYNSSTTAVASTIPVYNASAQLVGDITGNSATTTKLLTARTIATSGDATGTATSFDGSANITIPLTLANSGATAGTYKSVTVNAKGLVTGGTNPTTLAGYGITDAISTSGGTSTGNITAPVFVSNVATGTAPFTVTSTTKVPNLNADTVDGYSFNQDVQTTASPTFTGLTVNSAPTITKANGQMLTFKQTDYVTAGGMYQYIGFGDDTGAWKSYVGFSSSRDNALTLNNTLGDVHITPKTGGNTHITGTADATGNITAPVFISNVVTGSAPLTVASTTVVPNLNVDQVDGYDASTTAVASKIPVYNASAQLVGDITGNSATATKLATARTIATSGDATGTATSFDGSANITIPLTLAASGVTAGTYKSVTVDTKGRVTGGTNPTTVAGYGITDVDNTNYGIISTANYTKYPDGTLIVHDTVNATAGTGLQNTGVITFPVNFISTPDIVVTHRSLAGKMANWYVYNPAINGFTLYHQGVGGTPTIDLTGTLFAYTAVGKWK